MGNGVFGLTRWAEFVLRRRKTVVFFWLAMVVVGMYTAGKTSNRLSVDFSLPGQPGYETSKQIVDTYGNGGEVAPSIVVVTVPETTTVQAQATRIDAVFAQIQQAVPTDRLVDYASTANPVFITSDQRTTYALAYPAMLKSFTQKLDTVAMQPVLAQAEQTTGFDWGVTGYSQLSQGGGKSNGPSILTETMIGGLGALAVLAFLFASFLALVPLVIAAVSILSSFSLILLGTYVFNISFVVQFLVALVGLGVAVDYSLLLVNRWREERAHGRDNHDAIVTAMRYAGHAVLASAGTVAVSMCSLLVIPVPLLRSMGIGGMLIPLVSTAVVMTLLPAILGGIGPRVDWPRIRNESRASRAWTAWTRGVVRFRWPVAVGTLGLLVALLVPIFGIKIGTTQTDSLAHSGPAYTQFQTLTDGGVPTGVVSPMEILVKGSDVSDSVNRVVSAVKTVPGVSAVLAPDNAAWRKDGTAIVDVHPDRYEIVDSAQAHIAESVKSAISGIPGVVGVAGTPAAVLDYINAVYKNFPYTLAVIALVTFLLLVRTFRSILLPIKAVLLNILSVGATFGATVLFWQDGHGSKQIFGIAPTGAVEFWLPVLIFAFLFGLSMDYEVFILARMREEYDRTGNTDFAVVEGLGRTGRLVTGAATILFLSFVALAASPGTDIKVFATALGIGILLDATIVRALLVPALVSLFGKWNWYLPDWVAKVLRIKPVAVAGPRVTAQATGPGPIAEIPAQLRTPRFELEPETFFSVKGPGVGRAAAGGPAGSRPARSGRRPDRLSSTRSGPRAPGGVPGAPGPRGRPVGPARRPRRAPAPKPRCPAGRPARSRRRSRAARCRGRTRSPGRPGDRTRARWPGRAPPGRSARICRDRSGAGARGCSGRPSVHRVAIPPPTDCPDLDKSVQSDPSAAHPVPNTPAAVECAGGDPDGQVLPDSRG